MKYKILITGGSGFIGTNFIEYCIQNQKDFFNFDKAKPINSKHNKYWSKGNLLDKESIFKIIKEYKPKIIIHLAARADCDSNELDDYIDNTVGTQNLIDCIKEFGFIEKVIITSTQYVYKSKSKPFPASDDEYIPHTVYGESKVITEQITRDADLNCVWTIVRPANVWGPWHMRYPNELWKMIAKGFYLHPGKKEVIRTYAYVENVVHQIVSILDAPVDDVNKKTFYLGDLPVDSYYWLNNISHGIKGKSIIRIPRIFLFIPSIFGSFLSSFGVKFPLTLTRYKNMIEDYYAPTNLTIAKFGSSHPDIVKNIEVTVKWIKKYRIGWAENHKS